MKTVIVLRGIPGSGKSTLAKQLCADDASGSTVRINNDEIVGMLYGVNWRRQPGIADVLKLTRETLLKNYLQSDFIKTIIVDNTNLTVMTVRSIQKIASRYGATFVVDDSFLGMSIGICVERDALRADPVGESVIRSMAKDAAKLKPWKYPAYSVLNMEPVTFDPALRGAYLFDIDGTMAWNKLGRSPYDESRVLEDDVHSHILEVYHALRVAMPNRRLLFLTGRHESCRKDTLLWLQTNVLSVIPNDDLIMRPADDDRPDYIVKYEMYRDNVAGKYNVLAVFDDRDQVVQMWRKIGIKVLQVAEGDF